MDQLQLNLQPERRVFTVSDLTARIRNLRVRSRMAPRLAIISARIASTAPSRPLGAPPGPARLGGPGSADRVQRVGLALTAAVLAVGAAGL